MRLMARIRVDYWEKWGGEEWEAMASIVRSFNDSQDKYEVVMTSAGDWSSSPNLSLFLSSQKLGQPPDVIGLEDHQIVDLANQGALIALNKPIEVSHISLSSFDDRFLELCIYAGKLYGVPVSADIVTLYVNQDALKATRFDGEMTTDLSEFDAGLEEFETTKTIGFVPTYPGWWPHSWPWFFGGSWIDEQNKFTPRNPANIKSYEWISSFRKRWDLETFSNPVNPIGQKEPDPFLSGKVAMVLEGDWLVRRLLKTPTLNWIPAAFPTANKQPAALILSDVLSIPQGARNAEGSVAFIDFAMKSENVEQLALGQCKISPRKHHSKRYSSTHRNPYLKNLQRILSSAELFHDPRVQGWLRYSGRIKQTFQDIWSGRLSPAEALKKLDRLS